MGSALNLSALDDSSFNAHKMFEVIIIITALIAMRLKPSLAILSSTPAGEDRAGFETRLSGFSH